MSPFSFLPMPTPAPSPISAKVQRRWLRLLLWGGLALAVVLVLLHRPLFQWGARALSARLASQQGLTIDYELGGNLWSQLELNNVRVTPTSPGPIQRIEVKRITAGYSLWYLLTGDTAKQIDVVEIEGVRVEVDATKSVAAAEPIAPAGPPGKQPAVPMPKAVRIRDLGITVKQADGRIFDLAGFTFDMAEGRDGTFAIERLVIPGLKPVAGIQARTSYDRRTLALRDLIVPGIAKFETMESTLEGLPRGEAVVKVVGDILGGRLVLNAKNARLLERNPVSEGAVTVTHLPLRWPDSLLTDPPAAAVGIRGELEELNGAFELKPGGQLEVNAVLRIAKPGFYADGAELVRLEAKTVPDAKRRDLVAVTVEVTEPRAAGLAADHVTLTAQLDGFLAPPARGPGNIRLESLEVVRGKNVLRARGTAAVRPTEDVLRTAIADFQFDLAAPDLGQLSLPGQDPPVLGTLNGQGRWQLQDSRATGAITLDGGNLRARGFTAEKLSASLRTADGLVWIERFDLQLDAANRIGLGGYARLDGARDFRAEVAVDLAQLATLEPAFRASGLKEKLEGAVAVHWLASGRADTVPNLRRSLSGGGTVNVRGVKYGANAPIDADLSGMLSGEAIDFPTVSLRSGELELSAELKAGEGLLNLEAVSLRRKGESLLSGHARVPFDPAAARLTEEEKIDIDLVTVKPLALAELWTAAGRAGAAPAEGTLAIALQARGGLRNLSLDFTLQGRGLKRASLAKLQPADVDLALNYRANRAALHGTIRQPQMQPITLKAEAPLDLVRLMETKHIPRDLPLSASLKLPPSSLGALVGLVPGLRFLEGNAGADIRLDGTLAKPALAGTMQISLKAARFENPSIPALRAGTLRLAFTDREVKIEQGTMEIAGGTLAITGGADYAKPAQAMLDFAVKAKDILVARDENVLVRTNLDLKVAGPLATALVSGRVGLTKSRFLKDIDIIPLPLLGDRKPPPSAPPPPRPRSTGAEIGITTPPLRDWKFDLVIQTDDPFRVRGNLANGRILVNLKLTGTGGKPLLEGPVDIEQFTAKLPFSRLDVERGTIYFSPDQPLNPLLDINGASQIRDRRVNISIFGRADDPKTAFTSEPPLPQEQILTLLATGATLDELRENTGALAGKATVLALQKLWGKVFKSNTRSDDESLLDRFDFDLGNVDPKTGKQTVSARYRATDRVSFLTDFDADGNFRGRVRYVFRFR